MTDVGKRGLINWFSCSRDDLAQAVLRKGGASPASSQLKRGKFKGEKWLRMSLRITIDCCIHHHVHWLRLKSNIFNFAPVQENARQTPVTPVTPRANFVTLEEPCIVTLSPSLQKIVQIQRNAFAPISSASTTHHAPQSRRLSQPPSPR
jgi:hypothetical protein